jgi:hypothetical protein
VPVGRMGVNSLLCWMKVSDLLAQVLLVNSQWLAQVLPRVTSTCQKKPPKHSWFRSQRYLIGGLAAPVILECGLWTGI